VLLFDPDNNDWVIGNYALRMEEETGIYAVRNLMANIRTGGTRMVNGREYTYKQLMAAFFGKLIEFIRIRTSVMYVENITITMNEVDEQIKESMEDVFSMLGIDSASIRLLSYAESFGYFFAGEAGNSGKEGAILFDFGYDGFFAKQLKGSVNRGKPLLYVDEYDFSKDFSIDSLASEMLRQQMDEKLSNLFLDMSSNESPGIVYFTGEGFSEQWFYRTLSTISGGHRAFKGNNLYVKGACLAGFLRYRGEEEDCIILCKGRTRVFITLEAWDNGNLVDIMLSPAAVDWYDAGFTGDFILENEHSIILKIHSLVNGHAAPVEIVLSGFPQRPVKTTRVEIDIRYRNDMECVVNVTDKGFGDFFRGAKTVVTRTISMADYI